MQPSRSRNAAKGAAFENRCRRDLEETGWRVIRSAASKGEADLWAARREGTVRRLIVVQAKTGRNGMGIHEWNRFVMFADNIDAEPILADKAAGVAAPRWWRITGFKEKRGHMPRIPFDIEAWK